VHPYNEISAGGPQVRLGDQVLRARLVTTKLAGRGALECLCTDLRIGAAVSRGIGQQISVVTNLPPLPPGTSKVAIVLPGLTKRETRYLMFSIPPVTVLFLIGVLFAWFILIPPALSFLVNFQPDIFQAQWTADHYLGFVTALLFWMGVAFETPLIFFVLSILGFVTPRPLIKNWRIAVIGSAIAAAVITPTVDPVNMMLVMGPLMALYLLSIGLVSIGMRFNRPEG